MEKRGNKENRKSCGKNMKITSVFRVKKCLFDSHPEFKSPHSKIDSSPYQRRSPIAKRSISPEILLSSDESPYSLYTVRKRHFDASSSNTELNKSSSCIMNCTTPLKRCSVLMREIVDETALLRTESPDNPVKIAVQKSIQNPDLIGDFSKPCVLPIIEGKHPDLKSISPNIVADLLQGKESSIFTIVDCRYPYEYAGGHVKNAQNIYCQKDAESKFFSSFVTTNKNGSQSILIFYCEFSSERAPNMMRFLRSTDRDLNKDCYPHLYYPELYLIDGGYKSFYSSFKILCEPQDYKPMLDKECAEQMSFYRNQCKNSRSRRKLKAKSALMK